jgi:hypothetical protein
MSDAGDDYTEELVMFETRITKEKSEVQDLDDLFDVPGLVFPKASRIISLFLSDF